MEEDNPSSSSSSSSSSDREAEVDSDTPSPLPLFQLDPKLTATEQRSKVNEYLDTCRYRLDVLERTLRFADMTMEQREKTELELEDLKKILSINEEILKEMQRESRLTLTVPAMLFGFAFFCFCLYSLFTNPN